MRDKQHPYHALKDDFWIHHHFLEKDLQCCGGFSGQVSSECPAHAGLQRTKEKCSGASYSGRFGRGI